MWRSKSSKYHGLKAIDKTCRNHGGCERCEENRKHKYLIKEIAIKERMKEFDNS